jgi:hypothetical protein
MPVERPCDPSQAGKKGESKSAAPATFTPYSQPAKKVRIAIQYYHGVSDLGHGKLANWGW